MVRGHFFFIVRNIVNTMPPSRGNICPSSTASSALELGIVRVTVTAAEEVFAYNCGRKPTNYSSSIVNSPVVQSQLQAGILLQSTGPYGPPGVVWPSRVLDWTGLDPTDYGHTVSGSTLLPRTAAAKQQC